MADDDEAPDSRYDNPLKRIAQSLGVPVASFFTSEPSQPTTGVELSASPEEMTQALAVLRLFLRLKDPEARARCITVITRELLQNRW